MKKNLIISMLVTYLIGLVMILSASNEVQAISGYFIVHLGAFINIVVLAVFGVGYYEMKKVKLGQAIMIALPIALLMAFRAFVVKS